MIKSLSLKARIDHSDAQFIKDIMTQNTSDKKLSYLFITSCEENNIKKVGACIILGVDVNTVSEDGKWSGLTIAAHKNYIKLLDLLLSQPAIDVNLATKSKWTPLMFAGAVGHHDIMKKLVQDCFCSGRDGICSWRIKIW